MAAVIVTQYFLRKTGKFTRGNSSARKKKKNIEGADGRLTRPKMLYRTRARRGGAKLSKHAGSKTHPGCAGILLWVVKIFTLRIFKAKGWGSCKVKSARRRDID